MAAKKTIQKTKADDCPECVDRMITSEPPSVIAEKTSYQKPWVISGPVNFSDLNAKTALPPKSSAVEGPDYSDQMNLNAGRTIGNPSRIDRPMGEDKPLCTDRQCPNELPADPTPEPQDGQELDEDIIAPSEPTPCVRTTYRMLMGLIPAILAVFLSQAVIATIETASGLLAPPFVIIFPGKFFDSN
jgi:hypothetical protein